VASSCGLAFRMAAASSNERKNPCSVPFGLLLNMTPSKLLSPTSKPAASTPLVRRFNVRSRSQGGCA
jgi:hypothetical protein